VLKFFTFKIDDYEKIDVFDINFIHGNLDDFVEQVYYDEKLDELYHKPKLPTSKMLSKYQINVDDYKEVVDTILERLNKSYTPEFELDEFFESRSHSYIKNRLCSVAKETYHDLQFIINLSHYETALCRSFKALFPDFEYGYCSADLMKFCQESVELKNDIARILVEKFVIKSDGLFLTNIEESSFKNRLFNIVKHEALQLI
jgi:hypothetical protein